MSHDPLPQPPELPADPADSSAEHSADHRENDKTSVPDKTAPSVVPANNDVTRAGMVWVGVVAGLLVLVLLIVFILQNQDRVEVHFLGFAGALSIGMALFIAAVGGGILVAIAGAVRILQLRRQRRRRAAQLTSGPRATGRTKK